MIKANASTKYFFDKYNVSEERRNQMLSDANFWQFDEGFIWLRSGKSLDQLYCNSVEDCWGAAFRRRLYLLVKNRVKPICATSLDERVIALAKKTGALVVSPERVLWNV